MSTTEWFEYSIFSNLSYVRWSSENAISVNELIRAVVDAKRLPTSIAEALFKGPSPWTIPAFHPNDNSGFAANIFQSGEEVVLAIRGTEANLLEALPFVGETGWQDLLDADIADIGLVGFALDQTVSLVNYVMQLQGASGTDVTQVALRTKSLSSGMDPGIDQPYITVPGGAGAFIVNTYYWLEEIAPAPGFGVLTGDSNVSVTGHSLGGHLAVMAIRLFPELIDHAITFNAPGFDPSTSKELTDQFVHLFGEFLSITPADTFAAIEGRVTAIESESSEPGDDLSGVASQFTGTPVGQEVLIHTEMNSHSMDQLMDALAVHSLVATLNPTLDIGQLLHFYDGVAIDPGATEETLVASLAKVILGKEPTLDQVEAGIISHGDFADRVQIHDQIVDIQNEVLSRGLVLDPIWNKTAEELVALAEGSIAYRYAILNLDPFVVLGDESLYLEMSDNSLFLSNAHGEDYWFARSEMLLAQFNLALTDGELDDTGGLIAVYTDLSEGVEVSAMATGVDMPLHTIFVGEQGTGLQFISGADEAESIFGGIGADRLAGGEGSDFIDGGAGSDVLIAGDSIASSDDGVVDWLEGGTGADFYYVGNGDVISDSDRVVGGIVLSGWSLSVTYEWVSEGVFESADGGRTLEIFGDTALITLTTLPMPSTITILDFLNPGSGFRDGDFAISLLLPDDLELPTSDLQVMGTVHDDNPWQEGDGMSAVIGTNGSEGIASLEGNDFIYSMHGMDFVDAGAGRDVVLNVDASWETPDFDGDTFLGGPGDDALTANSGDDWLLGGDGDDFIQGGGGMDLVSGGAGNEVVFGGDGDDIIYGDAGDDIVDGDKGLVELDVREWLRKGGSGLGLSWLNMDPVESSEYGEPYGNDRIWGGSGSDYLLGGAGDDELYGGSGPDTLAAGYGADKLFGDSGKDVMRGGYGEDLLHGGSEADAMFGDEGEDELHGNDGNDRLAGGPGEDLLVGGLGNDRYEYSPGDGWDRIREVALTPGASNSISFDLGDYSGFYQVVQSGTDLVIQHFEEDAGIIVEGWFADPESILDEVQFYDRILNIADLAALAAGQGTRWNDWFYGSEADDWFVAGEGEDYGLGGDGDDAIFGGDGIDMLTGDAGNDSLYGGEGPDFIDGGSGDDLLIAGGNSTPMQVDALWGGEGSDTYVVDLEADTSTYIVDIDAAGDDYDVVQLLGNVRIDDLIFRQIAVGGVLTDHLAIDYAPVGGVASEITIFHWLENTGPGIDAIELTDGSVLTADEINARLNSSTNGRDYLLGSGATVTLSGLAGDDQLYGHGDKNDLQGGVGSDQLYASGTENVLEGGNGADRLEISHGLPTVGGSVTTVDILLGGGGADILESSFISATENDPGTVLMDGGNGADTLLAQGAQSVIIAGGKGFDSINGELSTTDAVILLNRGDQGDVIRSSDGWAVTTTGNPAHDVSHVVSFGGGITLNDISLRQDGNDLLILTGPVEGLRFVDYFDLQGDAATWLTHIQLVNQATSSYESGSPLPGENSPIIVFDFNPILSEYLQERTGPDDVWRLVHANSTQAGQLLPEAAFGGQVAYEYALLGNNAYTHLGDEVLPALRGIADVSAPVSIHVLGTEPVPGMDIGQLQAPEDDLFQFRFPEYFMVDPITQEVLQLTLASNLPVWLSYNPLSRELSGTPGQQDIGTTLISISAVNRFGQETTVTMDIITPNTNDLPVAEIHTGSVTAMVGEAFQYALPTGMFSDEDPDDHLTLAIAAPAGGTLPDWMQFAPDSGVLSGTPPLSAVGNIDVVIIATDSSGGTASSTLALTIEPGSEQEGEIISGTGGRDVIAGSEGNDTISGGDGSDKLHGGPGDDRLDGGENADSMFGGPGQDQLLGGKGSDRLAGEDGNDVLLGGQGRDRLFGGTGDDYLSGEQGIDRLMGGAGDDVLVAEFGNDRLEGGFGDDSYEVHASAGKVMILELGGEDDIKFMSASSEDARISRQHDNLVVSVAGTKTKVVVSDWFANPDARVDSIAFNDGVTFLEQDVLQLVQQRAGFAMHTAPLLLLPEFITDTGFVSQDSGMERLLDGNHQDGMQRWLP